MYLSFNMWRKNTLWDPAVALVAKERDGWKRKMGLHVVARMMTDRQVYCLAKGWRRWRRVTMGCRSLAKVFVSSDKRSLRSSIRQWLSVVSDSRSLSLKSSMRRSAVRSLLLRSAGSHKAWSFEVLRLEVTRHKEAEYLHAKRLSSLLRWSSGARRRSVRSSWSRWLSHVTSSKVRRGEEQRGAKRLPSRIKNDRLADQMLFIREVACCPINLHF